MSEARQYNRRFLQMCSHHLIEPVACTPASGWEKGQVENQVGNLRDQLFRPKPRVKSLAELNAWLEDQCIAYAKRTKHPEFKERTIWEVFQGERASLMELRGPFDGFVEKAVRASTTCLIMADHNRYSVDARAAGRMVLVRSYAERTVVLFDDEVVDVDKSIRSAGVAIGREKGVTVGSELTCRGTRPTQAARWRPFLNSEPSPIAATTAVAVLGPTPLIFAMRRQASLLRKTGWVVNFKRVERIWRREGLKVPHKQPKRGRLWLNDGSCIRLRPEYPNHVWSYDFVEDRTHDGRKYRMLNIIDEFTRECLAIRVNRKLNSTDVIDVLSDLFIMRGVPGHVRSDNVLRAEGDRLGRQSVSVREHALAA